MKPRKKIKLHCKIFWEVELLKKSTKCRFSIFKILRKVMKQKLESNANWIALTNNNLQICSHGRVVKALDLNSNGVSLWLLLESFDPRFSPYISVSRDSMGSIYMFLGLLFFKQNSIVEKQICVLVHNFACFKIYLSMHVNCNTLKLLCYCILLWRYRKLNQFFSSKFPTLGEAQTHSLQNYENEVLPIVLLMPVTIWKMF